jgi:DNA-binding response OmpR family regulator
MSVSPKPAKRRSILIVEDSVDFANLLKFVVDDDGFEGVIFPLKLDDICAFVKEHDPAAVLMDLALGRKGGMEYIERLKADPETSTIPIVIITGRELPVKEVAELQTRGIRYLRKGRVEMDEMRKIIKEAAGATAPGDKKR